MYVSQITPSDEIHHHGVMGMKWGTRRSYNRSINTAGKHIRKSSKLDDKATRHKEKLDTLKGMPGASSNKKVQKMQKKFDKEDAAANRHAKLAHEYVKKAAETGVRSYHTESKDMAKIILRASIDPVFSSGYERKVIAKNYAADVANAIQDEKRKK